MSSNAVTRVIKLLNIASVVIVLAIAVMLINRIAFDRAKIAAAESKTKLRAFSGAPQDLVGSNIAPGLEGQLMRFRAQDISKLRNDRSVLLLDVRERENFAKGHLPGALNMPISEIQTRAEKELPSTSLIVVDCGYKSRCESISRDAGRLTPCTASAQILAGQLDFPRVAILAAERSEIAAVGIAEEVGRMPSFE